jgi:hypothetical protein
VTDVASSVTPGVRFSVAGVESTFGRLLPALRLQMRAEGDGARPIRGLALTARVVIAAERRRYTSAEAERLGELFGPVEQWGRSLGAVPWLESALNVPGFSGTTTFDVTLPCSYDFEVASAKYVVALEGGEIPVDVLLSGMVFYHDDDGRFQGARIPWDRDVSARIPVAVWRAAVDAVFPDAAWLRLGRDRLAALQRYRSRNRLTSWDEVIATLLSEAKG